MRREVSSTEVSHVPQVKVMLLLFLTCVIDAREKWHVIACDILRAFMQADMDELVHLKLEGEIAELLIKVDESYAADLTYK